MGGEAADITGKSFSKARGFTSRMNKAFSMNFFGGFGGIFLFFCSTSFEFYEGGN